MTQYSVLVILLAIMVLLTNIIVEVIKSFSPLKEKPTKAVTTVIAIILCVIATIAYFQIYNLVLTWYIIVASIIIGIIVAYGAIFGFDNLYGKLLDKIKELLTSGSTTKK